MEKYNMLYSSDIEDIKEVQSISYVIENEMIIFIGRIQMSYDTWYHDYKIGRYDMSTGWGNIITKKGIKEYQNLKSLCKATENFNAPFTFEYNKVIQYRNEYIKGTV